MLLTVPSYTEFHRYSGRFCCFFQALLQEDSSANYEDERVSYSANGPVEATQDDYVHQALNKEEQTGLHCSEHSGKLLIASATYIDKNDKGT